MRQLSGIACSLLLGVAVLAPAAAQASQPMTAADFNLFVLGNQLTHGSDVEGAVAVGGNAHFDSFSIGAALPSSANNVANLVVGGNLSLGDGSVRGKTLVGGTYSGVSYIPEQSHDASLPVNFTAEDIRLNDLTKYYAGLSQTGGDSAIVTNSGQDFTFNALKAGLNVIDISGAALSGANEIHINLGANSTVIIDVDGAVDSLTGGVFLNGSQLQGGHLAGASDVLWNFADATSLTMHDIGMIGSVLAPDANVFGSGVIDGQLVVDGFNQYKGNTMQVNWAQAAPGLLSFTPPSVPEPATWAMMVGGFGLVGAVLRRRRRAPLAA
jgi:choice-of-anchor A domain-containing protein